MWLSYLVECLLSMHEALGLIPSTHKPGMVVHISNTYSEVVAGGLEVNSQLLSEFKTTEGYIRPY